MNLQKLKLSQKLDNVFRVHPPYDFLIPGIGQPSLKKNKVIFWGTCFKQLPDDLNISGYVETVNKCLDYIRRECRGHELYYKPHPAEKNESNLLNLESFKLVEDPSVGEVFLWKNWDEIAYSFSVMSNAAISAYDFGINSYVFYKLFKPIVGEASYEAFEDFFRDMPNNFFINDLDKPLADNKQVFGEDRILKSRIKEMLENQKGKIWFVVAEPALIIAIASLAVMIKKLELARQIGLIISRRHRWGMVDIENFKCYFDTIDVFPRIFYTLRPNRLLRAAGVALRVKKFKINSDDVIIGFAHDSLLENCFISYFPRNKKIALFSNVYFDLMYNGRYSDFFARSNFKRKFTDIFWNLFLEPLLGINKTLVLEYGDGRVFNIVRYQKPINELYDEVYLARMQRG